jgi:hypothetical protein
MIFAITLLVHLASIATLYPAVASETSSMLDVIVVIQFPLMACAAIAHTFWKEEDEKVRSRLARLSLTFGITYICILLLATLGVSIGPADPFGAPEVASAQMRLAWFVGFSLIASLGSRFFILVSVLGICEAISGPIRRAPSMWLGVGVVGGVGMGVGAVAVLHSQMVVNFAAGVQDKMETNPAPYIIGFIMVPMLLAGIARIVRPRRTK